MFITVCDINGFSLVININQITAIDFNESVVYMSDHNIINLTNESIKAVYVKIRGVDDDQKH